MKSNDHRTLSKSQILLLHTIRNGAEVNTEDLAELRKIAEVFPGHLSFKPGDFVALTSAGRCAVRRSMARVIRDSKAAARNLALLGLNHKAALAELEVVRTLLTAALAGDGDKRGFAAREPIPGGHADNLHDATFRLGVVAGLLGLAGEHGGPIGEISGYIQQLQVRYALRRLDELMPMVAARLNNAEASEHVAKHFGRDSEIHRAVVAAGEQSGEVALAIIESTPERKRGHE